MEERASTRRGGPLLGPRIVAVVLIVGALILIREALAIRQVRGFTVVGPTTIPLVVAFVLLVLGVILAARTTLWPDADLRDRVADEERATHWPSVGLLLLVLVVYGLALDGVRLRDVRVPGLGYVLSTGLFMPVAARDLGSTALLRDFVVGFAIAVVVYVGFTQFLGVRLPAGPLGMLG